MNDQTGSVDTTESGVFARLEALECIARRLVSKICAPAPEAGIDKVQIGPPLEDLGLRITHINFMLDRVEDELNRL